MHKKNGGIKIEIVEEIVPKIVDSDKRFVLTDSENFSSTFDLQFDRVLSSGIPDQECVILCM
ncbi:MAG: hypothetical protein US83_C0004G0050 [Candidatus Falkowbacteria bacterium GW2011_GWC2_38_22]|uniref:Uncharacterized protein n=1 Tax=Candidatus Falkowbacteria bacterium GW2011_GWE1_38_31 TaxID=1618638 RepID=A0A0G0JVF7_9BACT|nr:MAG: hypothetical protein US73_C0002G0067 [Candidatus Falkowbacteria bacterium GW2011_GWF2_38_1205]KKQ61666.1 MAG: hypothetical protein US83_C0004G0050 [Candidatus Falkowbacteria bacterium GW2011_GWC2_38_22]KKQ63719.1 MAG: hypothetical protein US84_C0004G0067 [Candidatus Falkowbacteria bacterium GW2011_GWF1_38_22]KKQ65865.1 MAG: hypothetical protein US87_C0004G0050 [Candidatus Falkowbacteria bacterium GW2011_GWE2_38_254]KKQ70582.1 MAG: hypothetical protein US91_C0004G0067 [Candidatus Falkowb